MTWLKERLPQLLVLVVLVGGSLAFVFKSTDWMSSKARVDVTVPALAAAARRGVRQHHWRFGDMPPQPQVSDAQLAAIVRFIREAQVANGIR